MKKTISLLLMLALMTTSALALRAEDKTEPIDNFKVYKWISPFAENKVVVLTVNSGERGVIVIDLTSEDDYEEALETAKSMLNAEPTEYSRHGTPFAIVRAKV